MPFFDLIFRPAVEKKYPQKGKTRDAAASYRLNGGSIKKAQLTSYNAFGQLRYVYQDKLKSGDDHRPVYLFLYDLCYQVSFSTNFISNISSSFHFADPAAYRG